MADNRSRLEKLIGMLGSDHDGEALNALRMIKKLAADEKKSLPELLLSGKVVYQERVVYRDRDPGPGTSAFRQAQREWQAEQERQQRERQARREQERREREKRAEEDRRQRYGGAFDDAELSDEEREELRRQRANKKRKAFRDKRELLDELAWAYENNDDDLTGWEIEFASSVPFQYRYDWELSKNQEEVAQRIINKVRRNKKGSPI
jgi:hypothetical protein